MTRSNLVVILMDRLQITLFLDFHLGCVGSPGLVVFWVTSAIDFSICAKINHSLGSYNGDIHEIHESFTQLKFMWWQLVIDYPNKSFDNWRSQGVALR